MTLPAAAEPDYTRGEAWRRLLRRARLQGRRTRTDLGGDLRHRRVLRRHPAVGARRRVAALSRSNLLYLYGRMVCMKKTLNIDAELLREAKSACGATTDTDAVRLGLESLVRAAAYDRLRKFIGSEPDAVDVPRRRERPARGRHQTA